MGVAKSALDSSVQYLAWDLGQKNIRVNAISAGPVGTLAARSIAGFPTMESIVEERSPLHRPIDSDDVGAAAAYLLSDEADNVTATTLYVDSGFHAMGSVRPSSSSEGHATPLAGVQVVDNLVRCYNYLSIVIDKADVIEFRLSGRSRVPTYLQLVQQVRQAVRLGVLQPGDQLPTVKEVVGTLAINPNTVRRRTASSTARAVEARRGQGTFVSRKLTATAPAEYAALQSALLRWITQARDAGLDEDDVAALLAATVAAEFAGGSSVSSLASHRDRRPREALRLAMGSPATARAIPAGSVAALVGPNGAGKTTLMHMVIGLAEPSAGRARVLGWSPREQSGLVLPPCRVRGTRASALPRVQARRDAQAGPELNPRWDDDLATSQLAKLGIPLGQKVGKLSGG